MKTGLKPGEDYRMVHVLVKRTAEELAGAYYEHAASNDRHGDEFYRAFPNQKKFIKAEWANFIYYAKQVMTQMLCNPMTNDAYKIDLHEALTLDATLPYSQQETQITNFRH